jgi:alkylhydroperoxidase family enzyme
MSARIEPAAAPYSPEIAAALERLTPPGTSPLVLFTTIARDQRLFNKLMSAGLLDRGNLTLREREIVILRTTARCGSAYEWGVHVAFFSAKAKLEPDAVRATVLDGPDAPCWSPDERALIAFCDALHETCTVDDARYADVAATHTPEAILEILMLAGYYRTISYLTNALRLPLEAIAAPMPQ